MSYEAVSRPFIRSLYNYDRAAASRASGLAVTSVTRTQQQFAEEVDINTIVKRFGLTGQVPVTTRMPTYADFMEVCDFQTAMQLVRQADEAFMSVPAEIRARFANDPQLFLEFCSDSKNLPELRALGLAPALPLEPSPLPGTPES